MIRYALGCAAGHAFDGWFRSSADFDTQAGRRLVTCPVCGSTEVEKRLMAPAVRAGRDAPEAEPATQAEPAETPAATLPVIAPDPRQAELVAMMRALKAKILESAENVGDRFADEARKIAAGDAEERGIYGEATLAEAKALMEEGIAVAPLPILPEERN